MKYIFIRRPNGDEFPVFCLAPQKHSEMATAWRRDDRSQVVSAGFCEFLPAGIVRVFGRSDSLNFGPRPGDAATISAYYLGTLTMTKVEAGGYGGHADPIGAPGPIGEPGLPS